MLRSPSTEPRRLPARNHMGLDASLSRIGPAEMQFTAQTMVGSCEISTLRCQH